MTSLFKISVRVAYIDATVNWYQSGNTQHATTSTMYSNMLEKESVVSINQDLAGANNKDEVVSILSQHGLKIVGDKTGKAYTISFVELDNMPLRNAYLEAKPAGGGGDFHYSLRSKKIRPMKPHDRRRIDKIMGPYTEEVDV